MKIKHIKVHAFLAAGGRLHTGDILVGSVDIERDAKPNPDNRFTFIGSFWSHIPKYEEDEEGVYTIFKHDTGEIIKSNFGANTLWYLSVDEGSSDNKKYFNKVLKKEKRKKKEALAMKERESWYEQ